jgi:hypothetical protein
MVKNTHKNLGSGFLLLTAHGLLGGGAAQKSKKRKKGEGKF